jgi:hypothetical protein
LKWSDYSKSHCVKAAGCPCCFFAAIPSESAGGGAAISAASFRMAPECV